MNHLTTALCHKCMDKLGWVRADEGCHTASLDNCPNCGEHALILPLRHWRMRLSCSVYETSHGYEAFIVDNYNKSRLLYASEGSTPEEAEANVWKIRFDVWEQANNIAQEYMGE